MNILIVYAHPNPKSFCHAILQQFTRGLEDAGHTSEVVDLYAIGFDPVIRDRDTPGWIDDSVPDDVLEHMNIRASTLEKARNPLQKWMMKRWMGDLDARGIVRKVRAMGCPPDIVEQQAKIANADALAFIAPVYFVGFPAILKGWIERVFTVGFAFGLKPEAWRGDIGGRIPLLKHEKALIMQTTLWGESAYEPRLKDAMTVLIDEYALLYPGVKRVEREYFYAVHGADEATRHGYLDRAYRLGREF